MDNSQKILLLDLKGALFKKIDDDKYEEIKKDKLIITNTRLINIINSLELNSTEDINELLVRIIIPIDEDLEILKIFYNECTWTNIINRIKENLNISITSRKEKNLLKKLVEIEKIIHLLYFKDLKLDVWSI